MIENTMVPTLRVVTISTIPFSTLFDVFEE
jgi:hypothetical protein